MVLYLVIVVTDVVKIHQFAKEHPLFTEIGEGTVMVDNAPFLRFTHVTHPLSVSWAAQLVKKHAYGGFFDDFCTVCLGAYGSPGGKRR